jgi:hypothetical protein
LLVVVEEQAVFQVRVLEERVVEVRVPMEVQAVQE